MRKTHRIAIDDLQFEFTELGAVEGVELFHDLRKAAMPALRALLSDSDLLAKVSDGAGVEALEANALGKLAGVVLGLFEAMPKQLERDLRAAFARTCKVGVPAVGQHGAQVAFVDLGDPTVANSTFDQQFARRYGTYQKWLIEGLKFNFAGFLGGSGSASAPASPATPSP